MSLRVHIIFTVTWFWPTTELPHSYLALSHNSGNKYTSSWNQVRVQYQIYFVWSCTLISRKQSLSRNTKLLPYDPTFKNGFVPRILIWFPTQYYHYSRARFQTCSSPPFLVSFSLNLSSSFMLGHPPDSQYQLLLFTFTLQKTIYARSYQFPKRFTWHLWLIPRFFHITICLHPMVLCKIQSFRIVLTHHQETPGKKWLFWTFEQLMKGVGFCFSREPYLIYHHNSSL